MTLKITTDNISPATLETLGGGVKITSLSYPNSATAADPAGSETVTVTGSGFLTGAKVYIDTTLCTTTYVSATSLTFTSPAKSIASYHLFVYNTDGSNGMMPVGMVYSSLPTWVTASGALAIATLNTSYSQTVSATGDGTITYSLTSGSLPTGLSLNSSTGAITGTAPNTQGTSTFTITATDSQNQKTSRSFTIQVLSVLVQYLIVGGGAGSGTLSGGGGAGGVRTGSTYILTGITYTVTVGAGGAGSSTQSGFSSGYDSSISGDIVNIISSGGGAGGPYTTTGVAGTAGGSGGGGGGGVSGTAGAGGAGNTPSTSPSQGNSGGAGGTNSYAPGGGGGGAGGTGNTPSGTVGGSGGVGYITSIITTTQATTYSVGQVVSSSVYVGGGGGGAGSTGIAGGYGGGGAAGGQTGGATGTLGSPNTGGGAGAGWNASGAQGGSGLVIITLPTVSYSGSTTGSVTPFTSGSNTVIIFKTSGTITF